MKLKIKAALQIQKSKEEIFESLVNPQKMYHFLFLKAQEDLKKEKK